MSTAALGAVPGSDGRLRCPWALGAPDYLGYHDDEWGRVVHGDQRLFERLSLEAFQSGLSWITILRKRPAFRAAFAGFEPSVVAAYGVDDVARLLSDAGIVRNRSKILATIANARAVLDLDGRFDSLLWSFAPDRAGRATQAAPTTVADVPALTPESTALARALRSAGFRFVGPTTSYALMQAVGIVDDHLGGCIARGVSGR